MTWMMMSIEGNGIRMAKPSERRRHRSWLLASAILLFGAWATADAAPPDPTIVTTKAGIVQGALNGSVRRFLGIPYARPPVGTLRWADPEPAEPWTGIRPATQFGNFCAQNSDFGAFAAASVDEDCLFLNVFAPKAGRKHPVMVWIYGGGNTVGMSNGYDGTALTRREGVVVVTLNYRMNAFGFLIHAALDGGGGTTNYALRDQQLALRWVKNNIANFGGDADNVTIFGESAGALDVVFHLVSPQAKGLFHRVILESGAYELSYWRPLPTLEQGEARGRAFATALGCPDQSADCMRQAPVSAVLAAAKAAPSTYAIDGHILTRNMRQSITSGDFNRVPILDGTNHDEGRWFQAFVQRASKHQVTPAEYETTLAAGGPFNWLKGMDAKRIADAYALRDFGSPDEALAAASGDAAFSCVARNFDVDASRYVPVYAFEFNDPNAPSFLPAASFPYRATHTHEMQYIFPGWKGASPDPAPELTAAQQTLSDQMIRYWATFAANAVPDRAWPPFHAGKQVWMSLETPRPRRVEVAEFSTTHRCALWDSFRDPSL
jgi:para-nitrobenzyl esterase